MIIGSGNVNPHLISNINLKRLEGAELEAYEKQFGTFEDNMKLNEEVHPDRLPDNHPSNRVADVVIGDQRVATIYKHGISVENRYSGIVVRMDRDGLSAEQIAAKIAEAVGGRVAEPRDWS